MSRYVLNLITDAVDEPITVAEAKDHLRIDGTTEDAYIQALIMAARKAIENEINRPIGEQTFEYCIDSWPTEIKLPQLPYQSLVSIKYTLEDESTATVLHDTEASPAVESSIFYVDAGDDYTPGTLRLYSTESWPDDTLNPGYSIKIRFTAGITDITEDLRLAHLMTVAHWYEHREAVTEERALSEVPLAAKWLLDGRRYLIF